MIQFLGQDKYLKSKKRNIKTLLYRIAKDHHKKVSNIDYIFISDEELLQINISSLQHHYYTDIITFDYSENDFLEGEIYISIDRIIDNAKTYKEMFHVELLRVIIHGVLHMLGYQDKTKLQKKEMRKTENKYIDTYIKLFHVEQ